MSVVVGLVSPEGQVILGADSAITSGNKQISIKGIKLFPLFDLIIGACGMLKPAQVLKYELVVPEHPAGYTAEEYVHIFFIPALTECFKEEPIPFEDESPSITGASFLVGYQGQLFEIDEYLACTTHTDTYAAIGSGSGYALGSLATTELYDITPKDRVQLALEAAAKFDPFVCKPFNYVIQ